MLVCARALPRQLLIKSVWQHNFLAIWTPSTAWKRWHHNSHAWTIPIAQRKMGRTARGFFAARPCVTRGPAHVFFTAGTGIPGIFTLKDPIMVRLVKNNVFQSSPPKPYWWSRAGHGRCGRASCLSNPSHKCRPRRRNRHCRRHPARRIRGRSAGPTYRSARHRRRECGRAACHVEDAFIGRECEPVREEEIVHQHRDGADVGRDAEHARKAQVPLLRYEGAVRPGL